MITAKLQLLKDTFESKFDIDNFKAFTREFFNEPEMLSGKRHTGIWREYQNSIISYSDIAKFKDAKGNNIIVFAVELKNEKGVERARSLQRNFISKILDDKNSEAAIVAFYSENDVNWRLSFVRLDYTFKDKGLELDLTPARRYSYLLGENETSHTAQKQLYPIFEDDKHNPTLDEIEAAFSVERVTKDFFEQYRNKYYDLKEYLEKDEAFISETLKLGFEVDKFSEQFAKKLMGQLAFLYFLQKKGWLGVRIMPEDHCIEKSQFMKIYDIQDNAHKEIMKKLFINSKDNKMKLSIRLFYSITDYEVDLLSDCFIGSELDMPWGSGDKKFIRGIYDFCINNTNKNFFDDYLEPFFYDALNKRRKNQYYKQFNCKIPFLNGGLFEPLEGYHWKEAKFKIPNDIFSNVKEKGREADGILDIFDRYNFTMNEDEPLEKEVAVDPEMLGKIFENLLDGKDRKAKGAFYTPREIVHYMCQENLTNYLVNEVNVPYEDIKEFILYGELIRDADNRTNVGYGKNFTIKQSIFDKIVQIDRALENIKIADPAVGSGAFPLGMLNEIVRARNNITEYLVRLDKTNKLDRKYGENYIRGHRSQYKMKWNTIKNSIFAVDIEPSAVDIAKLRLWLSVVVEQEIDDENPEPHPLPNLDCNIMVGNSLIDEYEGIKLFDENLLHKYKNSNLKEESETHAEIASTIQLSLLIDHSDDMLKEMFELQDRLFDEDEEHKKKELKARIDKIRDDLIEYKLNRDGNKEGLNKYNEMKKLKMKPFFIWQLEFAKVFKEKGGFDIVVGNPPYLSYYGRFKAELLKEEEDFFKRNYKFISERNRRNDEKFVIGRFNSIMFFFERATHILQGGGTCSYIVDLTIHKNPSEDIRKFLIDNTKIIEIINNLAEFDNVGSGQTILSFQNVKEEDDYLINIKDKQLNNKGQLYKKSQLNYSFESPSTNANSIVNKINMRKSGVLGEYFPNRLIRTGITFTGQKDRFLVIVDQKNKKPLIEGRKSIQYKYCKPKIINYINYDKKLLNELNKEYEEQLDKSKNKKQMWIGLGDEIVFRSPKVIITQTGTQITATYSEEDICLNLGLFSISNRNSYGELSDYNLKYFLALLNSKLTTYYAIKEKFIFIKKGATPQIRLKDIKLLPIFYDEVKCEIVVKIVDEILGLTNADDYEECINKQIQVKKLSDEIDTIVYEFYNLSTDEISIINNFEKENN